MALENLNYDLCESCYQSVDEKDKEMYWPTKLNPWTQYAQVLLQYVSNTLHDTNVQVMKAKSVSEMVARAAEQFAEWPCLGYRLLYNGTPEDKFTWYVQISTVY